MPAGCTARGSVGPLLDGAGTDFFSEPQYLRSVVGAKRKSQMGDFSVESVT